MVLGILGSAVLFLNLVNEKFLTEQYVILNKEITQGSNFALLANQAGIATATSMAILEKAKAIYDLSEIVAGKELSFIYDKSSGILKKLIYEINKDQQLLVKNVSTTTAEVWEAARTLIEYEVRIDKSRGTIESSLYETVLENGLDERLALALAEMFAWQIDFAAQIQKGDSFKVIYEKKYRDGAYSHPGEILAAEFTNDGERFQGFYFSAEGGSSSEGKGNETKEGLPAGVLTKAGYYDENGNSLQKVFLKAPLQYKYISSGFSYSRFNPILKTFTRHRGIDYAAPQGTPAVAVGDGTVVQAGWNGDYGISVRVRHNEMYSTVYGHFMNLAKGIRVGAKVKQGQIVGYVGSTGLSTGPHLHYEMHKFGSLINPFKEKIPAGEPVKENDRKTFEEIFKKYQKELAEI